MDSKIIQKILFYIFVVLFVLISLSAIAVFLRRNGIIAGGDVYADSDSINTLTKSLLVPIGVAVIALFYSAFGLKSAKDDPHEKDKIFNSDTLLTLTPHLIGPLLIIVATILVTLISASNKTFFIESPAYARENVDVYQSILCSVIFSIFWIFVSSPIRAYINKCEDTAKETDYQPLKTFAKRIELISIIIIGINYDWGLKLAGFLILDHGFFDVDGGSTAFYVVLANGCGFAGMRLAKILLRNFIKPPSFE